MSSTRSVPGRRERKKQENRRHIAQTAVRLFLARGFDAVSVAEIAEAADVSKVTVFNYFPAKTDMVFALAEERFADPGAAVRDRAPGVSAVDAVRDYWLMGLAGHAEWTGCHDGIEPFVAMVWGSPTLLTAFGERARQSGEELAAELAGALGEPLMPSTSPPQDGAPAPPPGLQYPVLAAMIIAVVRSLADANLLRMMAGQSAADAEPAARADAEMAFGLLAGGIADAARRPASDTG